MTEPRIRTKRQTSRRAPMTGILGMLLTATLALAACGSDDGDPSAAPEGVSSGGGPAESQEEDALDFYQCLRDHGLDVEDPDNGDGRIIVGPETGIDPNNPEHSEALEECSEQTGVGGGPGSGKMADRESLIEFTACMRENGIDLPDPDAEGMLQVPENVDPDSAEWQAAFEECREHLSGGGIGIRRGQR